MVLDLHFMGDYYIWCKQNTNSAQGSIFSVSLVTWYMWCLVSIFSVRLVHGALCPYSVSAWWGASVVCHHLRPDTPLVPRQSLGTAPRSTTAVARKFITKYWLLGAFSGVSLAILTDTTVVLHQSLGTAQRSTSGLKVLKHHKVLPGIFSGVSLPMLTWHACCPSSVPWHLPCLVPLSAMGGTSDLQAMYKMA